MMPNLLLLLNVFATWYMVGLIWMVQIVHYQMFDRVGEDVFQRYAIDHSRLITPIVAIPMLIEIGTAFGLLIASPPGMSRTLLGVGVALVVVVWMSTMLLQIPCHERLARGFDVQVYSRLVTSNWIRTIAWSLRGVLMGYLLWQMLAPTAGRATG